MLDVSARSFPQPGRVVLLLNFVRCFKQQIKLAVNNIRVDIELPAETQKLALAL